MFEGRGLFIPSKSSVLVMFTSSSVVNMTEVYEIDHKRNRYPVCVVWTPIPFLSWLFPFVGHMGIAYTNGVVRDFSGPYSVSEDDMAFGKTTRFLQMQLDRVIGGQEAWDTAVYQSSQEYKNRMHNICCDNCHSHVSLAMNTMKYNEKEDYNMAYMAAWMFLKGKFTGWGGFLQSYLPCIIIYTCVILVVMFV